MATIYENVAYLSQEIGPRPAGTEEEQKAALYITEQIQKESGLPVIIEDFQCSPDYEIPKTVCCIVAILTMLLSIFAPILNLILVVLSGIAALLFALEAFNAPILSRFFTRGMSQNVVAKYEPGYNNKNAGRKRKLVLVARYDTGKVSRETTNPLFHLLPLIRWIELGGIVGNFVVLLLRAIINPLGMALIVFNILSIITMALCLLPILGMVFHQISAYNEGANCNASGVAALMDLAIRIGRARVPASELLDDDAPVIHGIDRAKSEGLLPEEAEVVYAERSEEVKPGSAEERLLAAKAAIAAMSGRPVSNTLSISFDEEETASPQGDVMSAEAVESSETLGPQGMVGETVREEVIEAERPVAERAEVVTAEEVVDQAGSTQVLSAGAAARARRITPVMYPAPQQPATAQTSGNAVPDWFTRAQQKVKKTSDRAPIHRSRYADAYDNAKAVVEAQRGEEEMIAFDTARRLQEFRESIGVSESTPEPTVVQKTAVVEATPQTAVEAVAEMATSAPAAAPVEAVDVVVDEAERPQSRRTAAPSPSRTGGLDALFGLVDEPETAAVEVAGESVEVGGTQGQVEAAATEEVVAEPVEALDRTQAFTPVPLDLDELRAVDAPTLEVDESVEQVALPAKSGRQRPVEEEVAVAAETGVGISEPKLVPIPPMKSQIDVMREAIPAIRLEQSATEELPIENHASGTQNPRNRISQELPTITMDNESEGLKQRAPLSETMQTPTGQARDLRASLPHLGVTGTDLNLGDLKEDKADRDSLRGTVPSLSGVLNETATAAEAPAPTTVNQAASFAASSATGAFEPIGDELVEDVDPEELYVDDVDDSAYAETMTETGAFSGPGYVEMPESRMKRLFGKFRRHKSKANDESTPQEWLDVDETFDARTVGAERGGWESFREDDDTDIEDEEEVSVVEEDDVVEDDIAPRTTTRRSVRSSGRRSTRPSSRRSGRESRRSGSRRWHGGAFSGEDREKLGRVSTASEDTAQETETILEEVTTGKSGEIFRFRHPEINVEVWFVALGAELANNGGMHAFLAEHRSELRGATILELEGIGAGELSIVDREGMYLSRESSPRIERILQKAASSMGVDLDAVNMMWRTSATACALRQGYQALQVVGELDGKPAFYGEESDVFEAIDEETLERNTDLLMEFIKYI